MIQRWRPSLSLSPLQDQFPELPPNELPPLDDTTDVELAPPA
eukprot:CAMPEP_0198690364 /NCGR_PEP_ID=MMETSP1468-20131203/172374_1 /TAXON_ID=1461545 /ORGANISM="Mantoniella sp, Strain CCMP1436" /LENGTH=41 /DNA_ID= /DNA_START= /DNA_END= /DNA_ORIENTATION=